MPGLRFTLSLSPTPTLTLACTPNLTLSQTRPLTFLLLLVLLVLLLLLWLLLLVLLKSYSHSYSHSLTLTPSLSLLLLSHLFLPLNPMLPYFTSSLHTCISTYIRASLHAPPPPWLHPWTLGDLSSGTPNPKILPKPRPPPPPPKKKKKITIESLWDPYNATTKRFTPNIRTER